MKPRPFCHYAAAIDDLLLQVTLTELLEHIGKWYQTVGFDNQDSRAIVAGGDVRTLALKRSIRRVNAGPMLKHTRAEREAARRRFNINRFTFDIDAATDADLERTTGRTVE